MNIGSVFFSDSVCSGFNLSEPVLFTVKGGMKQLRIELIGQAGATQQLGVVSSAEVFIGREPGDGGIVVDNSAVSRQHGYFFCGREQWLFKDMGSTNGTWHNGVRVKSESWRILRDGDLLQLADSVLRISEQGGQDYSQSNLNRVLVVFDKNGFLREVAVPEYGRALVVGGSRADFPLDGDLAELPTLVVERRGERICAFGMAREQKVQINEREMAELVALKDGDEIKIGQYFLLFSDPASADKRISGAVPGTPQRDQASISKVVEQTSRLTGVREWGTVSSDNIPLSKTQARIPFGNIDEIKGLDETQTIDSSAYGRTQSAALQGHVDRHPGSRFADEENYGPGPTLEALEDKVIIIIGGLLVVTLLVLVVWWVLG